MDSIKRSYWGHSGDCSACFVSMPHTQAECESNQVTCRSWVCGGEHAKADHMNLGDAINHRNERAARAIGGEMYDITFSYEYEAQGLAARIRGIQ